MSEVWHEVCRVLKPNGHLFLNLGYSKDNPFDTYKVAENVPWSLQNNIIWAKAVEVDVDVQDKDIRIDVFRASGPGGQSVNTTDSAVRITHLPSGIVVSQQDEKSQHKNKAKAMKILRARLYEAERDKQLQERAEDRKGQVGSGDRSERIRTYNYPQGRVTDHRINLTLHKLETILEGQDLIGLIEALITEEKARQLSQQN